MTRHRRHLRNRRDYLYDIVKDPDEKNDLAKSQPAAVAEMRRLLGALHLNQLLIKENRIWPPN